MSNSESSVEYNSNYVPINSVSGKGNIGILQFLANKWNKLRASLDDRDNITYVKWADSLYKDSNRIILANEANKKYKLDEKLYETVKAEKGYEQNLVGEIKNEIYREQNLYSNDEPVR